MVRRAGAEPGDKVFVTGSIGDAALGLGLRNGATWALTDAQRDHLAGTLPRCLCRAMTRWLKAVLHYASGRDGCVRRACQRPRQARCACPVSPAEIDGWRACRCRMPPCCRYRRRSARFRHRTHRRRRLRNPLRVCRPKNVDRFRVAAIAAKVAVTEIGTVVGARRQRSLSRCARQFRHLRASRFLRSFLTLPVPPSRPRAG